MRSPLAIGTVLAFAACGCSGGTSGTGGPMSMPTPAATVSSPDASVVTIVGRQGTASFSPNPAQIARGVPVVWRNSDTAAHRIVMNDGSFDSGTIAPGASSATLRLGPDGGGYHCTIHPTMMFGSFIVSD